MVLESNSHFSIVQNSINFKNNSGKCNNSSKLILHSIRKAYRNIIFQRKSC